MRPCLRNFSYLFLSMWDRRLIPHKAFPQKRVCFITSLPSTGSKFPRPTRSAKHGYCTRWCGAPSEGCARVAAACGARAWCRAAARARAAPARDGDRRLHAHDHTDDTHLLPADLLQLPLPTKELIEHEYPRNISDIGEGTDHKPSPVKDL